MGKLLTPTELKAYLKETGPVDPVMNVIINGVEAHLEALTGKTFGPGKAIVDEVHDGRGTNKIWAHNPIASLTALKFGRSKQETVNVASVDEVVWTPGSRRIVLPTGRAPVGHSNVWISYTSEDYLPTTAKFAVTEVATLVWRRRGNEDSRSEKIGDYWHEIVMSADESITWKDAVAQLSVARIG